MAIRNISSLLVVSVLFFVLGCQTRPRQAPTHPQIQTPGQPGVVSVPPSTSGEVIQVPDFVGQRAPRVGVIFGPGGAKTFAHIGVLQELEKYKIPVVATAGLEWGSLVGAIYAMNGQSHEVDWKMSQLPKASFSSKNLFSKKMRAATTKEFDDYLGKVFQNAKLDGGKIPFACPYIRGGNGKVSTVTKGAVKTALRPCWYYPPIFELSDTMAAPFAVAEAAESLRAEGAELIVLINVFEGVNKKDFTQWSDENWTSFSWIPVQHALKNARYFGVHEVISVDTSGYSMSDVDQRLRLILVGKQGAAAGIDRIVKKYDF